MTSVSSPASLPTNLSSTYVAPKPDGYFSCSRPELVALVPPDAARILDVGCAAGQLARALRASRPSMRFEIVGVEVFPDVARDAGTAVDRVIVGSIEHVTLDYERYFDCIILGDVLEHLVDPWATLQKLERLLRNSGVIIASIPNVQHWRVILDLVRGHWDYRQFGIMDSTHLRFFTKNTISSLFSHSGLKISKMSPLLATGRAKMLQRTTAGMAESFLAQQYLVVASPIRS